MVAPLARPGVFWGAPPHSPTTPVREETAFTFLLRGWREVLFQAEQCSEGRGVSPGCPCPGWHAGAVRSRPRSEQKGRVPRAGTPRLGRRRRSVFASAAAASGPLAARQALMFPLSLFAEAFRKTIGSDEGFPVPAAPASAAQPGDLPPVTSALGLGDGRCSGDYFEIKKPSPRWCNGYTVRA